MIHESKVISTKIYCDFCKQEVDADKTETSSWSDECETCGSHGKTELTYWCPVCDKYRDLVLTEW